jgi:hypothetical protein
MSHGAPAGSALLFATAEETLVETLGDVHAALDDAGCGYAGPTPLKPMDGPALEAFLDHLADPDAATTARPDRFPDWAFTAATDEQAMAAVGDAARAGETLYAGRFRLADRAAVQTLEDQTVPGAVTLLVRQSP